MEGVELCLLERLYPGLVGFDFKGERQTHRANLKLLRGLEANGNSAWQGSWDNVEAWAFNIGRQQDLFEAMS
ncbi:hypothetical protein R50073_49340 (plasmid) [Maricurvus nonylphenolicus]